MYRNTSCVRAYTTVGTVTVDPLSKAKDALLLTLTQYFAKKQTREQTLASLNLQAKIIEKRIAME